MTETLANLYITQGKYHEALKAYKVLCLKYPEKISLFADQIKFIKKQIKKSFRESAYYLSLKKLRKFYTKEGLPRH